MLKPFIVPQAQWFIILYFSGCDCVHMLPRTLSFVKVGAVFYSLCDPGTDYRAGNLTGAQ